MDAKKKARVEGVAVLALLVVFGATLVHSLKRHGLLPSRTAQPAILGHVVSSAPAMPEPREAVAPATEASPPTSRYQAADLRDPLKSLLPGAAASSTTAEPALELPVSPEAAQPTPTLPLTLQGLVWGGVEPKAIINNEVYGVGDLVGGAVITSIQRGGVTVTVNGTPIHLTMGWR